LKDTQVVKAKLKAEMDAFLKANMEGSSFPDFDINDIKYDPKTQAVELKVDYSFETSFMKIAGLDEIEGSVETGVIIHKEAQQSLSMALVLDKSGSMNSSGTWNWNGYKWVYTPGEHRMTALKNAVAGMTAEFDKNDPDKKYVRTGAVAYSSSVYGFTKMNWGTAHVNQFTQSLHPSGGTDSSGAMNKAYNFLKGKKEEKQHAKKNEGNPKKYILFMTDGANNYSSADTKTLKTCNKAKKNNITIYTVAFQAPQQGQNLLKACASSENHYFNATNSEELISVFQHIGEEAAKQLAIVK
ncbi:MAG: vWA domain-containing protein, partial [Pseudomonadota bacterium]